MTNFFSSKPFQHLKVVELASVLAGPAVGLFFAELGATVLKIENKTTGGDVTRAWRLPSENTGGEKNEDGLLPISAYYCSVNWNKTVYSLDFQSEKDQETAYQLLENADIVISNFKLSSAKAMGMDYDTLRQRSPRLIYAQLYSYSAADNTPAFDIVMQAETGFLYMNGAADGPPVKMPVALIDVLAAHQLKEAILVALWQRERTGEGAMVSTSLFDAAVASLANQATNWLMAGHIPQRMGCMHPNIAPYGEFFYTSDHKAIVIAVGTERQFLHLCQVLQILDLQQDSRFSTNAARVQNRELLSQQLKKAFTQFDEKTLLAAFKQHGVPAGSIRTMKEVFELEAAQNLVLEEILADGTVTKRVRTVVF
jgi:crotonobetainyl-CoA:carnitine CoA-transferase CaiB-like acyl-CoA transferase